MTRVKMDAKTLLSVYFSAITLVVWQCVSYADCQGFSIGSTLIPNHGLVSTQDINSPRMWLRDGLNCTYPSNTNVQLDWIRPDGYTTLSDFSHIFFIRRRDNEVYLYRNPAHTTERRYDGIWRCEIRTSVTARQAIETRYIGIYYSNSNRGILSPGAPANIQYNSLVSGNTVVFTLTFNTTGGPASYVTWTRDGINISTPSGNHFTSSQVVGSNYGAGDYSNTLTVIGRHPGVYGVSVTNDRTDSLISPSSVTVVDYQQAVITNITVVQSNGYEGINVSWAISNTTVAEHFSGYEVQYSCSSNQQLPCGRVQTVMINVTNKAHFNIPRAVLWVTYTFNIALVVKLNHYFLPGVSGVIIDNNRITTQGVYAPANIRATELSNITSVRVTWEQPDEGLRPDEYEVSYHRLNGECELFEDGEKNIPHIRQNSTTTTHSEILQLRAFSIYNVSVTGRKGALLNSSANVQFVTNTTVPFGAPQNLNITSAEPGSTNVTISWDSVECIHRNGLITHYIISYGPESGPVKNVRVNISEPNDGGRYTATGLDPAVIYVFKVGAVNDAGIGMFATILSIQGKTTGGQGNISIITGVIVCVVLILALLSVGTIMATLRVFRKKVCPTKEPQAIYEEPNFSTPNTEELKMETCPAYDVSNVKQS